MHTENISEELDIQIRWLIRRDLPEILAIENASFDFTWDEADFVSCLRQRHCIGMVAECNEKVIGFMIYELHQSSLKIINFAILPEFRRKSVGAQMVTKLVDKLSQQRRYQIELTIRETNLEAQLFFKKQGFEASSVLRGFYSDSEEDAYLMQYCLIPSEPDWLPFDGVKNRVSSYEDV